VLVVGAIGGVDFTSPIPGEQRSERFVEECGVF
jgi:hypothetical protein